MTTRAVTVLGVPVDDVTMAEAVDHVASFVAEGRRSGRSYQVATVNVDFVVNTLGDDEALELLQQTELSIPDGMPVVWGSKFLRSPLRERVTGVDLLPALAARAADEGYTMYLFGAAPGVAARAAKLLREHHPGVTVIADAGPTFAAVADMDPSALEAIRVADPDILCVALGNPKQERWIAHYRERLQVPVLIGVGGTFDLLVGERRRAPGWMRRTGLEWLWRAAQEPRRLVVRYARDFFAFFPRLALQAWTFRPSRSEPGQPGRFRVDGSHAVVRPKGRFSPTDLDLEGLAAAFVPGGRVEIDLTDVPFVDNVTAAAVMTLARQARRRGAVATVTGVSPRARRCLARLRIDRALLADHPGGGRA